MVLNGYGSNCFIYIHKHTYMYIDVCINIHI